MNKQENRLQITVSLCRNFITSPGRRPSLVEITQQIRQAFLPQALSYLQNHHHGQLGVICIGVHHNYLSALPRTSHKLRNCCLELSCNPGSRGIERGWPLASGHRGTRCHAETRGISVQLPEGGLMPWGLSWGIGLPFVHLSDKASPLVAAPDTRPKASFRHKEEGSSFSWHMSHLSPKQETPRHLARPWGTSQSRQHVKNKSSLVVCFLLRRETAPKCCRCRSCETTCHMSLRRSICSISEPGVTCGCGSHLGGSEVSR